MMLTLNIGKCPLMQNWCYSEFLKVTNFIDLLNG